MTELLPEPTQEQIEAAARAIFEHMTDIDGDEADWLYFREMLMDGARAALKAAAAVTPEKDTAPGHTDLMVSPESIEEYFAALPPDKQRDEIGYVPKDDPRLNTIIGPRSLDKRRGET